MEKKKKRLSPANWRTWTLNIIPAYFGEGPTHTVLKLCTAGLQGVIFLCMECDSIAHRNKGWDNHFDLLLWFAVLKFPSCQDKNKSFPLLKEGKNFDKPLSRKKIMDII